MTPLRQRMLEDMQLRNLCPETQRNYIHHVVGLARFYQTSPEHLSLEEIREYQLYLINERRLSPDAVNQFVAAAKFLYNVTLETPWSEGALPRSPAIASSAQCSGDPRVFPARPHHPLPRRVDDRLRSRLACL